jgi:hypothetical protein
MAAYPRVQTVVTFLVCTAAVAGVAAYVYGGSFASAKSKQVSAVAAVTSSPEANTLVETASWKETFFNITEDDKSGFETSRAKNASPDATAEDLSATDIFGREFFSKFMTLRQAGMISNPEATDALVTQAVEDSQLITDGPKVYAMSSLTIAPVEDNDTREAYANAVAWALTRNQPLENETIIAKEALETGNMERLSDIEPIIAIYTNVRTELLRIPVPTSAAPYHLKLVNGISEALATAVALRSSGTDPLQALAAASQYPQTSADVFYTVLDLRSYFDDYGIVFGPDDDAYTVFSLK